MKGYIVVLVPFLLANASRAFSSDYVPKLSNHNIKKIGSMHICFV